MDKRSKKQNAKPPSKKGGASKTPVARSVQPTPQKELVKSPIRQYFRYTDFKHPRSEVIMKDESGVPVYPTYEASDLHHKAPTASATDGPKGTGLSKTALLYAKALCNPFGTFDEYPCVPVDPPVPSQRVRLVTRGTFTTGTVGQGSVCVCPVNGNNDANTIFTTDSTYNAGTYFPKTGTGVTGSKRSLPYASADSDGISGRLVALGLRVRPYGATLNLGGIVFGLLTNDGQDLSTFTAAEVKADARTVMSPISVSEQAEWKTLIWRPTHADGLDYRAGSGDFAYDTAPSLGFSVAAAVVATPQPFMYELVEFWEFVGTSETSGKTVPSLIAASYDPVGLARVLDGIQNNPLTLTAEEWQEHTATAIVSAMAHSDSVAKTVEDLGKAAGLALPVFGKLVGSLMTFFGL